MTDASEKKAERLEALLARMPKAVRDEVTRLNEVIAGLQLQLVERRAGSYSSPVGIVEYDHSSDAPWRELHQPLPVDKPIRFYPRHLTQEARRDMQDFIEVLHERQPAAGERRCIIELRSGFGRMQIIPHSSNIIYIINDRL